MRAGPEDVGGPSGGGDGDGPSLEPFRPRRGRAVALASAVLAVVVFAVVALLLPGEAAGGAWTPGDRLLFGLCGVAIAALLGRYAMIRAVPTTDGLAVRNIFLSRTVGWEHVEAVRFGGGEPWVTLDLDDGDTLAVMAVQRADGERSVVEAERLATIVARHGGGRPADGSASDGASP